MAKIASFVSLAMTALDRTDRTPLHRQLYEVLRTEILSGHLKPGTRLPPTRTLAHELAVSRNTIITAYDQLVAEGYLESKVGMGTHVTHTLPETALLVNSQDNRQPITPQPHEEAKLVPSLSKRGAEIVQIPYEWEKHQPRAFCATLPAVHEFPFKLWEKLLVTSWRELSTRQLRYQSGMGHMPLRQALASYLQAARGVRCTPEQVVITNGAQQALTTIANLLLDPGDLVWLENPCYNGFKAALRGVLALPIPVNIDQEGLIVDEGIDKAADARLCFISPSHQYPLGVTMSLTRRLQLLQWAQEANAWIVEDDYDSEYRYTGYPLAALQRLDNEGHVLYVGTFSKVLFPTLRVGYMVVPSELVEPIHAARAHADRGAALLEQVVLAKFISEGHLARHIRRMRSLYARRQTLLIEAAQIHLNGLLDIQPHDAGLHLVGWLPDGVDDQQVSQILLSHGIEAPALSSYALEPLPQSGLVMGYGVINEYEILQAVKAMKTILQDILM